MIDFYSCLSFGERGQIGALNLIASHLNRNLIRRIVGLKIDNVVEYGIEGLGEARQTVSASA